MRILNSLLRIFVFNVLMVLLGVGVQGSALAAEYYVAVTGNDSNAGTSAAPFRTVSQGVSALSAGDTLYIRGGEYTPSSTVWVGASGTAGGYIAIRGYAGETAILDGGSLPADSSILSIGGSYVTVENLTLRNSKRTGISVWGGSHIRIRSNTIHGSTRGGIYVGYDDMTTVRDVTVESNTVYNNCLMNAAHTLNSGWPAAISCSMSDSCLIRSNRVYENHGEGIGLLLGSNHVVEGNTVYDSYSVGLYMDNVTDCVLKRNLVYSTYKTIYYRDGSPATAIQIANENEGYGGLSNPCNRNTVINNIALHSRRAFSYGNYQSGGGLKNTNVVNNTFYTGTFALINIDPDAHSGSLFTGNIMYQTGGNPMLTSGSDITGVSFHRNLWYGASAGIAAGTGDINADPMFASPGGRAAADYRLQEGSPAVGAADVSSAPGKDYNDLNRDSAPDMGALEYGAAVPALSLAGLFTAAGLLALLGLRRRAA